MIAAIYPANLFRSGIGAIVEVQRETNLVVDILVELRLSFRSLCRGWKKGTAEDEEEEGKGQSAKSKEIDGRP